MLRKIMLAVGTALLPTIALAATIDVTTADIPVGGSVEWTADNEYVLNGLVFVSEGSSLTSQPGTVIKGKPGTRRKRQRPRRRSRRQNFRRGHSG